MMNQPHHLHNEIIDVLSRIEQLNELVQLHATQQPVDSLVIESYERLRSQYIQQLEELLGLLQIKADIQLRAA